MKLQYLFLLLCLAILPGIGSAAEYIESFHADIEVQRNGDLLVTETISVFAQGKAIKRGIYRDFPTRYRGSDGGDPQVSQAMAQQVIDGVNAILEISHGKLRSGEVAPRVQIGVEVEIRRRRAGSGHAPQPVEPVRRGHPKPPRLRSRALRDRIRNARCRTGSLR